MTDTTTIADINKNAYIGRTATTPRPSATDPGMAAFPDTLARHQQHWDTAKRWDDENAQARVDRAARVEADRQAEAERRQVNARADLEAKLRREFLLNPAATVTDWEAVKDHRIREALLAGNPVEVEKARLRELTQYGRF
jgi:hypothetical protein